MSKRKSNTAIPRAWGATFLVKWYVRYLQFVGSSKLLHAKFRSVQHRKDLIFLRNQQELERVKTENQKLQECVKSWKDAWAEQRTISGKEFWKMPNPNYLRSTPSPFFQREHGKFVKYAKEYALTDLDNYPIETFKELEQKLLGVEYQLGLRFSLLTEVRSQLMQMDQENRLVEDELVAEWHCLYSSYVDSLQNS